MTISLMTIHEKMSQKTNARAKHTILIHFTGITFGKIQDLGIRDGIFDEYFSIASVFVEADAFRQLKSEDI